MTWELPRVSYIRRAILLNKQNVNPTQPTPALTPVHFASRRRVDTEDGSLASDAQLSHCGMFSYPWLGRETRPSVGSCVSPPTDPTPSTSTDHGVGYTNGGLQSVPIAPGA